MQLTKENTLQIKGISIILMFIHHLFKFPGRLKGVSYVSMSGNIFFGYNIEYLIGDFGKICVGIFLFLSGIGFYCSEKYEWRDFIKRIKYFYLNFLFIFLIFIPIGFFSIKGQVIKGKVMYSGGIEELFLNLSLIKTTYCGEWWYAGLYIEILLLSPLIFKLLKKSIKLSILFHLLLYMSYFLLQITTKYLHIEFLKNSFLYGNILRVLIYQIIFYMGILTAKFDLYSIFTKIKISPLLGILLVFISRGISKILGISYYIECVFVFFFIYFCLEFLKKKKKIEAFETIGKNSLNMWLIHSFFCYYYFQRLVFTPKYSIFILMWLIILTLIVSSWLSNIYKFLNTKAKGRVTHRLC